MSAPESPDHAFSPADTSAAEAALREAEARALAESGLGSGLLAQQASDAETVAVLKVCPQCGTEYETAARFCPDDGTALRPKGSDSLVGRVLADRYHILKRIGEGGMGRVYLGEHVKMNRQCAIKVMSPALVNDHESAARFAREASNAARIIHPNVAAVFDYGESDGLVYLVMEFVEGEPLSRLLAREAPLKLDRALDLAGQICDGLGAAHELGIVHRDLKPDNILITRTRTGREVAKVVDFGIAKAIQEGAGEGLTRTGQVIGTPEFMSPEQLLGDPIDARSDLYALGCILHLMLTAAPPFEAKTREQMIKRRLSEDAPHVHGLDPAIPESVARIVGRLLARTPGERYGSGAEVRDALSGTHIRRSGALPRLPTDIRPTPRSAPTVAFLHATQATTEVTSVPAPTPTRRLPIIVAGVAAIAAAVATVAIKSRPDAVGSERQTSVARDSVSNAAIKAVPPESIPGARGTTAAPGRATSPATSAGAPGATAPVTMLDSAKLKKAVDDKRQQDSLARIANAEVGAARAPIIRYKRAIESGNINTLLAAYPGMTGPQKDSWEKAFFARASHIDASVRYGPTRVGRDTAEAEFTLLLNITDKATGQTTKATLPQRAVLVRQPGAGWKIASLR